MTGEIKAMNKQYAARRTRLKEFYAASKNIKTQTNRQTVSEELQELLLITVCHV